MQVHHLSSLTRTTILKDQEYPSLEPVRGIENKLVTGRTLQRGMLLSRILHGGSKDESGMIEERSDLIPLVVDLFHQMEANQEIPNPSTWYVAPSDMNIDMPRT